MAEITCTYSDEKHTIDSFDNVINAVEWIKDAFRAVFLDQTGLSCYCSIKFNADELSYDCKSLDEFKRYAFGKKISVSRIHIWVTRDWVRTLISVGTGSLSEKETQEYIISSEDEALLVDLRDALRNCKKGEPKMAAPVTVACEQYVDARINIGDNNSFSNSAVGTGNTVEKVESVKPASEKNEKLPSKIFWQLIIPVVTGVIVIAICVWLGLSK